MDGLFLIILLIALVIACFISWKYKFSWADTFALIFWLLLAASFIYCIFGYLDKDTESSLITIIFICLIYVFIWSLYTLYKKY